MGILLTTDRTSYRRWVNVIVSLILPGAGHYLSNRRRAGLLWFTGYVVYGALKLLSFGSPIPHLTVSRTVLSASDLIFMAIVCADACRQPIPCCTLKRLLKLFAVAVCIVFVPFLFVRQFLLHPFYIPTAAMQPTLMGTIKTPDGRTKPGDSIVVDKLRYRLREPRRGDIVVFRTSDLDFPGVPHDQLYVKRVAGLPGERVSIHPPFLRINGTNVTRPEVFEKMASHSNGYSGFLGAGQLAGENDEIVLRKDEYLVLGDNAVNSLDGRYFGPIKRKSIIGKVAWIYSPAERKGWPQ